MVKNPKGEFCFLPLLLPLLLLLLFDDDRKVEEEAEVVLIVAEVVVVPKGVVAADMDAAVAIVVAAVVVVIVDWEKNVPSPTPPLLGSVFPDVKLKLSPKFLKRVELLLRIGEPTGEALVEPTGEEEPDRGT